MTSFCKYIGLFMLTLLIYSNTAFAGNYEGVLETGKSFYEKGEYEEAVDLLNKAVPKLKDKEDLGRAYLYLGLSYFLLGDENKAIKEFTEAKRQMPEMYLDPELYSPKIRDLYNGIPVQTPRDGKSSFSIEYQNGKKMFGLATSQAKLDYDALLLKLNIDVSKNKIFILNFNAGIVKEQAETWQGNPYYGAGLKINIPFSKRFSLNLQGEYMGFNLKNSSSVNYNKEIEYKEASGKVSFTLKILSVFYPYLGWGRSQNEGTIVYKSKSLGTSSSSKYPVTYQNFGFAGLRIAGKTLFLDSGVKLSYGDKEDVKRGRKKNEVEEWKAELGVFF